MNKRVYLGIAVLGIMSRFGSAQTSPAPKYPDVYFWNTPTSINAWNQAGWGTPKFHPMLRVQLGGNDNPQSAVNRAVQAYQNLPEYAKVTEKMSLLIQNFGSAQWHQPTAFFNATDFNFAGDFTTEPSYTIDRPRIKNPWMTTGIGNATDWMRNFRNAYQGTTLPTPTRFHFDTEEYITSTGWQGFAQLLGAYTNDSKWSAAIVPGSGNKTLAQLW